MNDEHKAHLDRVLARVGAEVGKKYGAGQQLHGGELWRKAGMLSHLEAETWDLAVYACTLREQLEELHENMRDEARVALPYERQTTLLEWANRLARILGPAQE